MSGRATSPRLWAGLAVAILVSAAPPAQARPGSVSDIDQAVTFQINLTHTGQQTGDTLVPPLTKMWSLAFTGAVSYPLIAEGKAFVTVANSGNYGTKLYALDATSGTELWSKDISGTYYWSNASYDAGKLFVVNFDGLLQAFDAPTGKHLRSLRAGMGGGASNYLASTHSVRRPRPPKESSIQAEPAAAAPCTR